MNRRGVRSIRFDDDITTIPAAAIAGTIGVLFPDQEPGLARAIGDAFDLFPL